MDVFQRTSDKNGFHRSESKGFSLDTSFKGIGFTAKKKDPAFIYNLFCLKCD